MAKSSRRSSGRAQRQFLKPELFTLPTWVHPELLYWIDDYKRVRDAIAGEKEIKAEGQLYLPMFDGMEADEYQSYLTRATYYNFTEKTLQAMTGSVLRRNPVFKNLPERLEPGLERVTNDNQSFLAFAEFTLTEMIALGRFGILVDMPAVATQVPQPYLTGYTAENILDWEEDVDRLTGRTVLTKVVLRELFRGSDKFGNQKYFPRYRVLRLAGGVYTQEVFEKADGDPTLTADNSKGVVTPKIKGKPLNFIPFFLAGVAGSVPRIKSPPLLAIANLNISHYQSYAHLEQGLFYTGFPIYNVEDDGAGADVPEFELGANRVWITRKGCSARIMEFNGHGLKFLENILDIKEQQASALGGRMMGVRAVASSESNNAEKIKERNEQAVLLKITSRLDEAFTFALRLWALMSGASQEEANKIKVEFNKDFLFDGIGAREFRAIHAMYKDGIIPIDVVYHYLRKGDVIPDWMTIEEFKEQLDNYETSFPNQPDAEARSEGFPDRKSQLAEDRADEDAEREDEQADLDRRSAEKQAADAAKAAAKAPKPGNNPGSTPGNGGNPRARRPQTA